MPRNPIGRFYDSLAEKYHLVRPGWADEVWRQAKTLDRLATGFLGPGPFDILDCTCGIGTQALGLAGQGHHVTGMDISPKSVARAKREAVGRALPLAVAVADMKALPVRPSSFDVVVSGDNAIAHLVTDHDLAAALMAIHRALRSDGLLILTLHTYENTRPAPQQVTEPQVIKTPTGESVSFQSWRWHPGAEHYDFENIHVLPDGDRWRLTVESTTLRAWSRAQITDAAHRAGYGATAWHEPGTTGFFQPVFTARPNPAPQD